MSYMFYLRSKKAEYYFEMVSIEKEDLLGMLLLNWLISLTDRKLSWECAMVRIFIIQQIFKKTPASRANHSIVMQPQL